MRLELLKVGHCFHPERMVLKGASWKPTEFPSIVSLIKHPSKGYIIFDTGYADHFTTATQPFPERFYRWITPMCLPDSERLVNQLAKKNIAAQDIKYIYISHFHADHIAGLKDFPNARFICSKLALQTIMQGSRLGNLLQGSLLSLLPDDFSKRTIFIEECKTIKISGKLSPFQYGYDVFNDGSLIAIALPGHAHGHYGLMVYRNKQPVFLIGDACWSIESIKEQRYPHPISQIILSNTREYYDTLDKLSRLHSQNSELTLLPSHCTQSYKAFYAGES
ncbi:MBL fold metallo-hydrolase [Psychromonas sp. MME2]|uniref:MBL fold metallo-hydrolase n=1 Tax=unclassified Psychromonas TaxID=2614957 RepID=UPI00339C5A20